jgi:hypothetical protein
MAHSVIESAGMTAQVFSMEEGQPVTLGIVGDGQELELAGYRIALGAVRRYNGLSVYNRPQSPLLVAGSLAMLFGLIWHFYHRHRDRGRAANGGAIDA